MDFTAPYYLSNHPVDTLNDTGAWLLSLSDGSFLTTLRYDDGLQRVQALACTVNGDVITQGVLQVFTEFPYGGNFSVNFPSGVGDGLYVSAMNTNEHRLFVYSVNGSVSSRFEYDIVNPDYYITLAGAEQATLTYTSGKWLALIEDVFFDSRIMSLSISAGSVTEHEISSEQFLPDGVFIAFPGRVLSCAVGDSGDVIYGIEVETYSPSYQRDMVFSRATVSPGGEVSYFYGFQLTDTDGELIGLAGDSSGTRFAALYKNGSDIKSVYGELSGNESIVFGVPQVIVSGNVYNKGGLSWQQGTQSVVGIINHELLSVDKVTVLRFDVDNFEVTPDWNDSYELSAYLSRHPSISFDVASNKVIIGMFGDGGVDLPEVEKIYVMMAEGEPPSISSFWKNNTLQREQVSDQILSKQATFKIIPGKIGQPYVSPTEATGPHSSASSGVNYVCERV